jgi:hypothetical protein
LVLKSLPGNFHVFVLVFCVQLLWELNPNKAKPLEFGGCKKNNQNVQKNKRKALRLVTRGPPLLFFTFISYFSPLSFSLSVTCKYGSGGGSWSHHRHRQKLELRVALVIDAHSLGGGYLCSP